MFNSVYVICDEFLKDFQKEIGVGEHTDYGLLTILKQAGPGRHSETRRDTASHFEIAIPLFPFP